MQALDAMLVLAHSEQGSGWGGPFEPWEIHPVLIHFPIAFLVSAVALDIYDWNRGKRDLCRSANSLLIAGFLAGWLTALAGLLAMWTVPAHTAEAHDIMFWHMCIQLTALVLFAWPAWRAWRHWQAPWSAAMRGVNWLALVLIMAGSALGGYIVYHGGAGVEPELLSAEVLEEHERVEAEEGD